MIVKAAGVKSGDITGGWPEGFVNKAKELGAVIKTGDALATRGDVAVAIYGTQEKIEAAAKALGVTPGFLMGWEEQDADSVSYVRHRAINDLLDKLSPSEVQMVEAIIRQIVVYSNQK